MYIRIMGNIKIREMGFVRDKGGGGEPQEIVITSAISAKKEKR